MKPFDFGSHHVLGKAYECNGSKETPRISSMVTTSPAPWANSIQSRKEEIVSQREREMQNMEKQKENAHLYKVSIVECNDLENQLEGSMSKPEDIKMMYEQAKEKKLNLSKLLPGMVRIQIEQEVESENEKAAAEEKRLKEEDEKKKRDRLEKGRQQKALREINKEIMELNRWVMSDEFQPTDMAGIRGNFVTEMEMRIGHEVQSIIMSINPHLFDDKNAASICMHYKYSPMSVWDHEPYKKYRKEAYSEYRRKGGSAYVE